MHPILILFIVEGCAQFFIVYFYFYFWEGATLIGLITFFLKINIEHSPKIEAQR